MPGYSVQLFQVRSYERREKCPFPWRQLAVPSQGKLLQSGRREQAGRDTASRDPNAQETPEEAEQVNRQAMDVRKITGPSQGLGGDLERFAVTWEASENCLVVKQNAAKPEYYF